MDRGVRAGMLALVAASILLLAWSRCGDPGQDPETAPPPPEPAVADPGSAGAPLAALSRMDLRSTLPTPIEPSAPPDLGHPFEYSLEVLLVDAFGLPVPDALVFAAPRLCGLSLWPHASGRDGRVRLSWRARRDAMELRLAVVASGVLQPMRMVDVTAGAGRRLAIVVTGRQQDAAALRALLARSDEDLAGAARRARWGGRRSTGDMVCGRQLLLFRQIDCTACHEASQVVGYAPLSRSSTIAPGRHPGAVFCDLGFLPLDAAERARREHLVVAAQRQDALAASARGGTVHGVVTDIAGRPVAGVPVAAMDPPDALFAVAWTDELGRYRLGGLPARALPLRAGGNEAGDAAALLVPTGGDGTLWNAQLVAQSSIRGTASDERGGPLGGWRVEFESIGEPFADLAHADPAGNFAIPGVHGPGLCFLWSREEGRRLPVGIGTAALPESGSVALRLDPALPAASRVRLRPRLPDRAISPSVDVHICQLATGRVALLQGTGRDQVFDLEGLCPGSYRIEVGAPGLGYLEAGLIHVDGHGSYDLGDVVMLPPGRVRLRVAAAERSPLDGPHELYRRTEAADVREQYVQEGGDLLLPAGEHLLLWQGANGAAAVAFTVRPAQTIEVGIATR